MVPLSHRYTSSQVMYVLMLNTTVYLDFSKTHTASTSFPFALRVVYDMLELQC